MPVQTALGVAIKARRTELGWTQEELAERISAEGEYVRQSEISRIENGRIALPRRGRLERLARVLDLQLGELLARSGWAGAEPHFTPSTADTPAPQSQADIADVSRPSLMRPDEISTTYVQGSQRDGMRSGPETRTYDPAAMDAFRRALATMRAESDRLYHNRLTASAMQRHFRQAIHDDPAGSGSSDYSESAVG